MANIYDKSSLVLIPSGTKTSKVYSQKPVNGDGDFTFSRSTAATRVNASGNIEKETSNLFLQSNSFDTTWLNVNTSETGGQTGYDGSSDAWLISITSGNARIYQNITTSGVKTFSVYAKAGSLSWMRLRLGSAPKNSRYFDLTNGVIGSGGIAPIDATITSVGGGWYRCSITTNISIDTAFIYPAQGDNDLTATSGNIYIQDAQLEQGLVARDYIETTTTALYGGITDNVPRLDYTDSSCPALLLEPQRTNEANNSEYLDGYSKTRVAFVQNSATSPEGVDNAVEFNDTATTGTHFFVAKGTQTNGAVLSFFAKQNTHRYVQAGPSSSISKRVFFDLQDGVMATIGGSVESYYGIEDYGNGWYRCYIEVANNENCSIFTAAGDGSLSAHNNYLGDGSGVYLYGVQVEADVSYHTSYIPTYGTSVSRVFEPFTLFDFQDNNLTTATSGTLMIHLLDYSENAIQFGFENDSNDSGFRLRFIDSDVIIYERTGSSNTEITNVDESTKSKKVALAWNGTNLLVSVNGTTTSHTITSSAADGNNLKRLNSGSVYALVNKILAFPTQLTEAELNDLTTL